MKDLTGLIDEAELHLPYIGTGRDTFAELIARLKQAVADEQLAIWFTPDAIRDAFDTYDEDDRHKVWVDKASNEELREIAQDCLGGDLIWRDFHETLEFAIDEHLE